MIGQLIKIVDKKIGATNSLKFYPLDSVKIDAESIWNSFKTIADPNPLILRSNDNSIFYFVGATVDVARTNTIKSTSVAGWNGRTVGEVKEYIQNSEFTVSIKCDLFTVGSSALVPKVVDFGQDEPAPYTFMALLNKVLSSNEAIDVYNPYLAILGITKLILKKADFKQSNLNSKYQNILNVSMEFVTDIDEGFLVENDV